LKALFHRPGGSPILRRTIAVGLTAVCALVAVCLAGGIRGYDMYTYVPLVFTTAFALVAAFVVERRRKPISATLELQPGRVIVRDEAGRARATLKARSVVGATTARLREGPEDGAVSLVLAEKPVGSRPTVLRLADEGEADEVRRYLGIGPGGVGAAAWPIGPAHDGVVRAMFQIAWRALLAWATVDALMGDRPTGLAVLALCAGAVALAMRGAQRGPSLQLSARGVVAHRRDGSFSTEVRVPFAAIKNIAWERPAEGITLDCAPPFGKVVVDTRVRGLRGLDAEEHQHVVAQLQAAVDRARQPAFFEEKTSRLELLRRRQDTYLGWLARLDSFGRSLQGARDYRAIALEEADLWNAVENPELDGELRAAAARVHVQADLPAAKKRIESTLEAERDPAAVKRIRVAIEPEVEVAVERFEELDRKALAGRRRDGW
jgi:hypothetical protein